MGVSFFLSEGPVRLVHMMKSGIKHESNVIWRSRSRELPPEINILGSDGRIGP